MKFYFVHFEHLKELQRDLFKFNQLCIATPTLYRHMVGLLNKWIHTFCFMMAAPVTALSTMSIGRHLMRLQLFQGISFNDLKRSIDPRWLFDHRCYIHLRWSCFVINDHLWGPSVRCGQILQKNHSRGQPPPFLLAMPAFWEQTIQQSLP